MTPSPFSKEDKESKENLEKRIEFLGKVKLELEKRLNAADKALEAYSNLQYALRTAINVQNIYDNIHRVEEKIEIQSSDKVATAGLQKVKTIIPLEEAQLKVPTIRTDTLKGKILALAEKGKLDTWRQLGEIVKFVEEERWNTSPQEVNNALNDLAKEDLIAKKHTDRNYYCLAQGVVFEGKKEIS
jgi:hypothetical protein